MDSESPFLFLGFCLDDATEKLYHRLSISEKNLFIQDHPDYLQEKLLEGALYLGKSVPSPVATSQLELYQTNILSLLQKVFPQKTYNKKELVLIAYDNTDYEGGGGGAAR